MQLEVDAIRGDAGTRGTTVHTVHMAAGTLDALPVAAKSSVDPSFHIPRP